MYYYSLGIFGYESSDFVMLANEKEYTEEEFEQCIVDVTPDCIKRYRDYLIREHKEFVVIIKFNDIDHWVVAVLCEKYGFQKITPISTTAIWQFLNLCKKDSVNEDMDTKLTENIRKAYIEKYVKR